MSAWLAACLATLLVACAGSEPGSAPTQAYPTLTACDLPATPNPVQKTFYVDTAGSDTNSGESDRPFQTIPAAQTAVRAINARMTGDIVVRIRPGTYFLSAPLAFSTADSGNGGFRVIYQSDGAPASARIVPAVRVTAWQRIAANTFVAGLPPGANPRTLYMDGLRLREARYPHRRTGALSTAQSPYLLSQQDSDVSQSFHFDPSDTIIPSLSVNPELKVFIWSNAGRAWFTDIVPVKSIDPANRVISLTQSTRYPIGRGARFFLQGSPVFLQGSGEFHVDTLARKIYLIPPSDVGASSDLAGHEVLVPISSSALRMVGAAGSPVQDIVIAGLEFSASDFTGWYRFGWPNAGDSGEPHPLPSFDRQIEMPQNRTGMIFMQDTRNISIRNSKIGNSGYSAIYMLSGSQGNCVYGNLIGHTGVSGIVVQGAYPGEGDVSRENVLSNNLIHDVGELVGNAAGVDISNSGYNEISHSEIFNSPRYGVIWHVGGRPPGSLAYARGNLFSHLNVHDVGQDSGDSGALYAFDLASDSTHAQNKIDQVVITTVSADASMADWPPNGVFLDVNTAFQSLSNILVRHTAGPAYRSFEPSPQVVANVSWNPGFDAAAMALERIGLKSDFPFPPVPGQLSLR